MTTDRFTVLLAVAAGLAVCASALADQSDNSASAGARPAGGPRMSLPGPRMGVGRGGSLLYRGAGPRPNMEYRGNGGARDGGGAPNRPMPLPTGPRDPGTGRPMTGGPFFGDGSTNNGWDWNQHDRADQSNSGGFHADGSVDDDHFRLRWHIGPDCHKPDHDHDHDHNHWPSYCWRYPLYNYWNSWWWYNSFYPGYNNTIYSGPWYGTDPFLTTGQPAATQQPASSSTPSTPRALTPIELADIAWQNGDMPQAISHFKDYIAGAPDDMDALRYLALAYIDSRKLDEAVAVLAMAYERTPQLASRPLPASDVPGGVRQMRRRVNAISAYANRTKTGSAWLTLAVLIQSEGRESTARNIVDRAAKAGLNPKIVAEMTAALGN